MSTVREAIDRLLPLSVHSYQDISTVFLVLLGAEQEWSLSLMAPWAVSQGLEVDRAQEVEDLSPDETGRLLLGASLLAVEVGENLLDPVFRFTGNVTLRLHSEEGQESWSMRAKGLPFEIVG